MSPEDPHERFYRDTESIAFPKIDDHQLALLDPLGVRRIVRAGEVVFLPGQRDFPMAVIIRGELEIYDPREDHEEILATPGERDFIGEVSMLTGTSALGGLRGKAEQSEILEIPGEKLRRALADLPGVGEPIIQAFMMRRQRLLRDGQFAGLRLVAHAGCQGAHRIDDFLDKNHIPHRLIVSGSDDFTTLCGRLNLTGADLPALIASNGLIARRPTISEVARIAGLLRPLSAEEGAEISCDLAIVGAGPAGLAAAVNAASEGLSTVVLESFAPGGQAGSSSLIENFFGFPTGISGGELTNRAQLQAFRFGAKFSTPSQALAMEFPENGTGAVIRIEGCASVLRAKCVIVASGAQYNRIEAVGLEAFEGLGVFYAATAMEAQYCRGADVFVAGAGNSAGQAAMFLSDFAAKVHLVVRGGDLAKSMSSYLSTRVVAKDNIEVRYFTEIRKVAGGGRLESVTFDNTRSGEISTIPAAAVFSMIGARPCTSWLPPEILTDEKGFILTGAAVAGEPAWRECGRPPFAFEASRPGIFAAGDVRSGSVKRCSAAVGEGSMAVENVHQMLGTYR